MIKLLTFHWKSLWRRCKTRDKRRAKMNQTMIWGFKKYHMFLMILHFMLFVLIYISNLLKFSKHLVLLSHKYLNSTKSIIILSIISKRKCSSYLYTNILNWNSPNYIGLLDTYSLYGNTCSNHLIKETLTYGRWGFLSLPV